ncbi:hypothetical protein BDV93DRAFT_561059 [Ceratobasidium sp. AG-I]|nr:hypothetical protein BDV93DRAFT_561059 [Ceratobasidium sp. AG-I]
MKGAPGDIVITVRVDWQQHFENYQKNYYWGIPRPKAKPRVPRSIVVSRQSLSARLSHQQNSSQRCDNSFLESRSKLCPNTQDMHAVGAFYEFTANDRAYYGQRNTEGDGCFIAHRDAGRGPNQAYFMAPGKGAGGKVLENFGMSDDGIKNLSGRFDYFFGDTPLKF